MANQWFYSKCDHLTDEQILFYSYFFASNWKPSKCDLQSELNPQDPLGSLSSTFITTGTNKSCARPSDARAAPLLTVIFSNPSYRKALDPASAFPAFAILQCSESRKAIKKNLFLSLKSADVTWSTHSDQICWVGECHFYPVTFKGRTMILLTCPRSLESVSVALGIQPRRTSAHGHNWMLYNPRSSPYPLTKSMQLVHCLLQFSQK